jgi:hypothetical protein
MARHHSEAAAAGGGDQQLAGYQRGLMLIVDYAERWPLQQVLTFAGSASDCCIHPDPDTAAGLTG